VGGKRKQKSCFILLCWFHVKKAWVDHLLPKVHGPEKDKLYNRMCQLMHCSKEGEFDILYNEIMEAYKDRKQVCAYIKNCWYNQTWKNTWPKFGRMFSYGHVDTTNIVERHWQYIKYTTLKGRINRSITDLVHALIGDSMTGSYMGGTTLEWFKQKQEISESKRFLPRANCKDEANRLREAERILERYLKNPSSIDIVDDTRLHFRVLSMSKDDVWYNVYFQCCFCDCLDYASKCKHLISVRLLIEQHMPTLRESLPLIDDALQMRNEGSIVDASGCIDGDKDDSIFATISLLKEALSNFEESLGSITKPNISICKESMLTLSQQLSSVISPTQIDMPTRGSIRIIQ
jgi:hypothetical protein